MASIANIYIEIYSTKLNYSEAYELQGELVVNYMAEEESMQYVFSESSWYS